MSTFSRRTAVPRTANTLALALDHARASGRRITDLTVSNPTRAGLPYAEARILEALTDPRALTYEPSPFGRLETREAIARMYAETGVAIDASQIILTAGSSEAYGFLFKLLCDEGDDILVPQPSYPLFDLLARFEGVTLAPYALGYDGRWHIDESTVLGAMSPRTRAILMVSPNNPTGSYVDAGELDMLARTGLPLVSDEVFRAFVLAGTDAVQSRAPSVLSAPAGLVFALDGLSKMAALPQMKLGWIAVGGQDRSKVTEALGRLELLADAVLSVGTPVQLAAPSLLAGRQVTHDAIMTRLHANLRTLRACVQGTATTLLDVEGGWYATLRLPEIETEESWTLLFLQQDGIYVHPGHFFDFAREAYIVVSLLTPEADFEEGIGRVVARVEARIADSA